MGVPPTTVSARDIIVGNGSGSGSTIQEAVDSAEPGDIILIKPGTYVENINVSNSGLTIKPETSNVFIKSADGSIASVTISNVGVTLTGLNIHGDVIANLWASDINSEYQINNPTYITNNIVENGGIKVGSESSAVTISGNLISGNGIDVSCCGDYNEIKNNVISNCPTGIHVYDERYMPPIRDNKISNCDVGIHVSGLSYDLINNEITNCGIGVLSGETGGASLVGNKITYCTDCGVKATGFLGTNYNNYFNNTVNVKFGDYEEAYVWNTTLVAGTNIIGGSYIGGNYWAKPDGTGFSQTAIDANGDGIADSAYAISNINIDYLPLTAKYNMINMIKPDANFTSNVTSGPAPLVVLFTDISTGGVPASWNWETGDGIYSEHAMNATHTFTKPGTYNVTLTVTNAAGGSSITKPGYITVTGPDTDLQTLAAKFSSNVTEGYAPLAVQFNDLSQNAVSRSWDFDNDGKTDSIGLNPVYVYTAPGTYSVNLTVTNASGFSTMIATINVLESGSSGDDSSSDDSSSDDSSSGGSSHSSNGGGAGGSPESARNVEVKELSQTYVTNDKEIKFDFPKNATCVVYVSFDSKKTAGKITTIVEQLKGKSTLVSKLPEGEVYKSFNVWVGNSGFATSKNIENPVVCFKVEKDWIEDKKISSDSIALNRYDDKKWEQLPVNISGEDNKYLYFTANVPEYASFAVTGMANAPEENATEPQTEAANKSNTDKGSQTEQNKISMSGFELCYAVVCILFLCLRLRK